MAEKMRWAILGTGKIARRFATALNNIPAEAELLAVGSRNQDTADAFGDTYNIPNRYAGYEQVVRDPEVDIVYIGTPGVFHHRDVTMCLENGKHVLCEKAMTINAAEAKDVIDLARSTGLFLMEAMWTRFFPIHVRIRDLVQAEAIGRINGMTVQFTAKPPFDPRNRFYDLSLGAGVLLDTGSYGISWAYSLLGEPAQVVGLADMGESGADYQSASLLKFPEGQLVSVMSSQISYDVKEAVIFGSTGKIVVHDPWYKPTSMTIHKEGQEPELVEMPLDGFNGYEFEIRAVMDCIAKGQTECEVMPLDESLQIMKTLDALRAQCGLKYPGEK